MSGVALGFSRLFLFLQAIKTEKIDKCNLRFSHFWAVNSNLLSIREDDNLAEWFLNTQSKQMYSVFENKVNY